MTTRLHLEQRERVADWLDARAVNLWSRGCKHVVTTPDPESTHDLMEQHYAAAHRREIDAMVGRS